MYVPGHSHVGDPCDDRSCEIWGTQMRLAKKAKSPPTTVLGVGDEVRWTPAAYMIAVFVFLVPGHYMYVDFWHVRYSGSSRC